MNREAIPDTIHPPSRTLLNRTRLLLSVRSADLQQIVSKVLMILRIVTRDHELSAERYNSFKLSVPAELTTSNRHASIFVRGESSGIG